jgi:hypothetical protein
MLRYEHPWLAFFVAHWPSFIYLPVILLVIVVLALVTRAWDKRDALVAAEMSDRAHYGAAGRR